ncbi:MAG: HEPN domain-containing protein [Thermoproteota archaeon]
MSGRLAEKLSRRASAFLREARRHFEEGEYDLAVFAAGQAAELTVKRGLLILFGDYPRIHTIRSLLSLLIRKLEEAGLHEAAKPLLDYAEKRRSSLLIMEDAWSGARYEFMEYPKHVAEKVIEAAEELMRLMDSVVGSARGS